MDEVGPLLAAAMLSEECGEFSQAALAFYDLTEGEPNTVTPMYNEAVQVAAVAVRIMAGILGGTMPIPNRIE
jgi:hypothetical protein